MNVKKQIGHDRCNGVSGALIFDGTTAIIENCLYSNGVSIANVCGNSKCEATNILSELYTDQYDTPTDKDNKSNQRYSRNLGALQHYFLVWKDSACEYISESLDQKSSAVFTYVYNIEDSSVVDNKTTWIYVDLLAEVFWDNQDKLYILHSDNDSKAVGWYTKKSTNLWEYKYSDSYTFSLTLITYTNNGIHYGVWRLQRNNNILEDGGNLLVCIPSITSTIYQDQVFETGSHKDFPVCKPYKLPVLAMFDEDSKITISNNENTDDSDKYLDPSKFNGYTSFIQVNEPSSPNKNNDFDTDLNQCFVVWSSFLYTDGNYLKWSEFPNVEYNIDFRVEIGNETTGDYKNTITKMNQRVPKNLRGRSLTISLMSNINVGSDLLKICDFYNGDVIIEGSNHTITYRGKCGVQFENIQFLTVKNLKVKIDSDITNDGVVVDNTTKFNHCMLCKDIDNLEIYNCSFNNKFIYTLNDVLNRGNSDIFNLMPFNAACLDHVKTYKNISTIKKTIGLYLINCKGSISKTSFIDSQIGIVLDQNSNIFFTKKRDNEYCVFKRTSINNNNMFKHLCCFRVPMIMFYVTGNSKLSTNLKSNSPIKYNSGANADIILQKYSEFIKNENFIVFICDPGSMFDHDYQHTDYSLTYKLMNKSGNTNYLINKGDIDKKVTYFSNSKIVTTQNKSNGLKIMDGNVFSTDIVSENGDVLRTGSVAENINTQWYWMYNVGSKPSWVTGDALSNSVFVPLNLRGITWNTSDNEYKCGYRCVMLVGESSNDNNGIEHEQYT